MSRAPVVLVTGAARRLGATTARYFHQRGYRVAIHYHRSRCEAEALATELCQRRAESAITLCAPLGDTAAVEQLPAAICDRFGRFDTLINNASSFFPTPWGDATTAQWDDLIDSNLKGPFFLSQASLPSLRQSRGSIVNLIDIHVERPLADHAVYCMAKAGLAMMTRSLARDSGVRVNGIAPGAILWPEGEAQQLMAPNQRKILEKIPMGHVGQPDDIARTAWFLACEAPYITGQIISVDGGRSQTD